MTEKNIKQLTTEFQKIAESCGGSYDGWGVDVRGESIGKADVEALGL